MKVYQVCFALAGVVLSALHFNAQADVSHIGIETMEFEAGELPRLNVNVVSNHNDLSLLTFYIRQKYQNTIVLEKLFVDDHRQNTFILRGEEKIIDPNSSLIVSEYRNGKWQQYSPVPLFTAETATLAASDRKVKPKAIKTMKSPESEKSSYQITRTDSASATATKPKKVSQPVVAASSESALGETCVVSRIAEDTLWKISSNYAKQWGTNVFGGMLALYDANPDAFVNGDIQKLKADTVLTCPSAEVVAKYQDINQDKATFDAIRLGQPVRVASAVELALKEDEEAFIADAKTQDAIDAETTDDTYNSHTLTTEEVAPEPSKVQDDNTEVLLAEADNCMIDKSPEDSLWRIATREHKQWGTNIFGAMLAIFDANPNGFVQQKIHLMRSDAQLQCPSSEILSQYHDSQTDKEKFDELMATHKAS